MLYVENKVHDQSFINKVRRRNGMINIAKTYNKIASSTKNLIGKQSKTKAKL
jgi:hypothetical protein